MLEPALRENDDPGCDPMPLDRAVHRASADLQRIVGMLVHYYTRPHWSTQPANRVMSWRSLLELEEQAFSDLGFQARHHQAIIGEFVRLSDSRLPGVNLDDAMDWRRDDERLPAVYLIVRAIILSEAADAA